MSALVLLVRKMAALDTGHTAYVGSAKELLA